MFFLCIVVDLPVAVKPLSVATETQQWIPFALLSSNKIFRPAAAHKINVLMSSCTVPDNVV
jgi:hypothetical protein